MNQQALCDLEEEHKHLPAQGSAAWLEKRVLGIGGSELATVMGNNKYKTRRALIEERLGMAPKFNGSLATRWGNVLEGLSIQYLEARLGVKISQFGSIPTDVEYFAYSPDGVACFPGDVIKLIEIKNPYLRTPNGKIPPQYKAQVYSGLDAVPLASEALFCDFHVRRCADDEICPGRYTGIIRRKDELSAADVAPPFQDYGVCDEDELDKCLEKIVGGVYTIEFIEGFIQRGQSIGHTIEAKPGMSVVGVLPLRLINCHMIPVSKSAWKKERKYAKCQEPRFIDLAAPVIKETIDTVRRLQSLTAEEQAAELDKMFGAEESLISGLTAEDLVLMISH